jgi:glycerophosphoryl diester phosphodiesterase
MTRYLGNGGPYPVAHRGGAGLAPENSLAAFRRAHDLGFRYLETDVRLTADGVCVAFHDTLLRRTLGVRGAIHEITWARLQEHSFGGEQVPGVDQLLGDFPDAKFMIDLKDAAALVPLIGLLRRHGALDRVCLAGGTDRLLAAARECAGPQLLTAAGWASITRLTLAARFGSSLASFAGELMPAEFVHVPLRFGRLPVYGPRLVSMAHDLGLRVMVWTVDNPVLMHRLFDEGADGVITDRPDLLREVLVARDAWTPPKVERRDDVDLLDLDVLDLDVA